ncbi:Surf6, partial [Drosophila busckii]
DDDTYEDYLLSDDENAPKGKGKTNKAKKANPENEDVDERLASMKNKLRQKKGPTTEKQKKRREAKKMKNSKGVKKLLQSSAKTLKNENIKQKKLKNGLVKMENGHMEADESKELIKPVKIQPVFNEESKIVYSKIDFAANPGQKAKKSHQNPKEILKKLKDTRQQINDLKEQGESEKAAELQNDIAWKKAFDKIEGKKVKDDTKLLQKAIKKRKVEKRVAKKKWTERKEKVDHDIAKRQKKRQENLDKRSKDKKNTKLKKASKKGRIIAGY